MSSVVRSLVFTTVFALACGGGTSSPSDSAADTASDSDTSPCTSDVDCNDSLFCNGPESCAPTNAAADSRGCMAGSSPCPDDCSETERECVACRPGGPLDLDGDGFCSPGSDCDDSNPAANPAATELCTPGMATAAIDEDCDPTTVGPDGDSDGYALLGCSNPGMPAATLIGDCRDDLVATHPGADEVCDMVDNDCDGPTDEGVTETYYRDADGDGFGSAAADTVTVVACVLPEGFALLDTDCDDSNGAIHPAAPEACDAADVDENCDGDINPASLCNCDAGDVPRPCLDLPGVCESGRQSCVDGMWDTCTVRPTLEICDGLDNDCDGREDEDVTLRCYRDGDNDGYPGAGAPPSNECSVSGRTNVGGCPDFTTNREPVGGDIDCDDVRSSIRPFAVEVCVSGPARDDDCDGLVDEDVSVLCYADLDNDGYTAGGTSASRQCRDSGRPGVGFCPPNWTNRGPSMPDCNDGNFAIHLGAAEICEGSVDENCIGGIDDGCDCGGDPDRACSFGDYVGVCGMDGTQSCVSGMWSNCSIAPFTRAESCNDRDDDCDGTIDEGVTATCWVDGDDDDYASSGARSIQRCSCPFGYTDRDPIPGAIDCDDGETLVNPSGSETCNGSDDDCDGATDEGVTTTCYVDTDRDGFGVPNSLLNPSIEVCSSCPDQTTSRPPVGLNVDCKNTNADVHPGQAEFFGASYCPSIFCGVTTPRSWDYDCDGAEDLEAAGTTCSTLGCSGCSGLGGLVYSGTPACGASVTLRTCSCGPGTNCNASTSSVPMRCR